MHAGGSGDEQVELRINVRSAVPFLRKIYMWFINHMYSRFKHLVGVANFIDNSCKEMAITG